MALIKKKIADGVSLNYLETDKFKTGYMSVNFIAPLDSATAAKNALIPSILLRGSVKYPNMAQINKKLDYLYAASLSSRCEKRGEIQIFGLTASMIDPAYTIDGENLPLEVTDMLADILFCPVTDGEAFNAAYTESEKTNLIDAINAKINNKAYYARMRCIEEMCKNERYGISETGTPEEVAACTAETVYAQYKYALKNYPVEIFFVGSCDIDALADKLTSLFDSIARTPMAIAETEIIKKAEAVKRIDEDMPVNQGKLNIGFRAGASIKDADYPAVMMFNEIFGGGVTSKLFMNVREKMSLCYYCSSAPDAPKGLIIVSSGIEVANREIAEKAIFDQLDAVKRGDFNEEEYESAKLGLINSYRELADSARGLEMWYLGRLLNGVPGDPDSVAASIERVTRDEIITAANRVSLDTVYFLNGTLKGEGEDA
ncbi:MAG: insulinase family protein [Clostridia bacterium]|nr:insulinase family protein [Clostridia bacterium]